MITQTHLFFSIVIFSFLCNSLRASSGDTKSSSSVSYILNCGVANGGLVDADGRKWDTDTKYLVSADNSIPSKAETQDPSLPSIVPYMSARVFTAESNYIFKVSKTQRHWMRLHFYPSAYSSLNTSDALFGVVVNGIKLLNNFSVSITTQALTQAYLVKEFSLIPSSTGILNVTFVPSPMHKGSYAFINGIQVISMPDLFTPVPMVGFSDQTIDVGSSALQTMFRLNVGGQYIAPTKDSGLSRTWFDDTPYLFGAAVGVTAMADDDKGNRSNRIQYSKDTPEYVAPKDVYGTFRTMGPEPKTNQNYNLTWVFQVDANFTYIVRLHFCELEMTKVNQRVFDIYINNQTAQDTADVIAWAGSSKVPVYKDYAMYVDDSHGDVEIWVALHPSVSVKPEYYDAILNGLEIFKMNDTDGSLAGPNPVLSDLMLKAEAELDPKREFASPKSNKKAHVLGAAGGAAAVGLVAAICFAVYQRKRREYGVDSTSSSWLPVYGNSQTTSKSTISGKSNGSSHLSSMAASLCRHFSLAEMKHGTKNFDESHVIGVGGFGKVYKGIVDGGTKVAIKRANPSSEQGIHEFQTEIEMLSKLRHRHLVSLIGYCEEDNEMILVYDYMAHGTMREHLYKSNKTTATLSWKQRLEICIGAARGLHYLHTGAKYTIIHRDVKTTNILLDDKWVAKVSDFGLSKTGPNMNQAHVSTVVKGSFGYLDPEYFRRQQLTEKSDVYSFGVVLFEVLTARPALNPSLPKEQVSLADWALHCQRKGILEDIIDPHVKGKINPECLKKFADTAEKCLSDSGIERPSMGDVLWNLEFALQLQENPDGVKMEDMDGKGSHTPRQAGGHEAMYGSIGGDSEDSEENSSVVFSQLIHPKGR